jgi:methionine-rich copper-binding protein CopC
MNAHSATPLRRFPPSRAQSAVASIVGLLALLLVAGGRVTPVAAQASLVGSEPVAGATMTSAPATIRLMFDERIQGEPASFVQVQLRNRNVVGGGSAVDSDTGMERDVPLTPGTGPGTYVVNWTVAALSDGTISSGTFTFTVDGGRAVAGAAPTYAFTPSGTHARGSGSMQLFKMGTAWQPVVRLTGVAPWQTYVVQVCDATPTCTDPSASPAFTSSERGTLDANVMLPFDGLAAAVTVTNTADPSDSYQAQLDSSVESLQQLVGPPDPGVLPDLP